MKKEKMKNNSMDMVSDIIDVLKKYDYCLHNFNVNTDEAHNGLHPISFKVIRGLKDLNAVSDTSGSLKICLVP